MVRINKYLSAPWVPHLLIGLVSGLVWAHTVGYQFVWDDRQFIQELQSIRSLKNIPEMFYSLEAQSSYPEGFKLFRPLRTAHYALLYVLPGKEAPPPWVFHLANVLWHSGAAMLLFATTLLLLRRLLPEQPLERLRWFSLWTALAFATHPVNSEVVCWAKSLDDAMAAAFTLAALRHLLIWNGGAVKSEERGSPQPHEGKQPCGFGEPRSYVMGLLWFLLAVYSKISAVPFALAAFFIFYSVLKLPWWKSCRLTSPFLAVAMMFMVHRHLVIGRSSQTAPISGTYGQTLLDMFPVAPNYLRLLCGVPPFHIDYSFMPGHWALLSGGVLSGMALLMLGGWVTVRAFHKPENRLVGFGLVWLGLFLLPVSNLMPMMQYMAERFLYLPLIGWLWVMAILLNRLPGGRASSALAGLLVVGWAGIAWNRSFIWQDEVTLFVQSSQAGPRTPRVQENAVAAIFELPHVRALFTLDKKQRALRVLPGLPAEKREAITSTLTEAHRLFPEDEVVSSALGILCALSKQYETALPFFESAVRKSPQNPRYWVNLGQTYLELQTWSKAEEALSKALSLQPDQIDALRASSRLWWQQQNYPAALDVFQKLKNLEPDQPEHDRWIQEARTKLRLQVN